MSHPPPFAAPACPHTRRGWRWWHPGFHGFLETEDVQHGRQPPPSHCHSLRGCPIRVIPHSAGISDSPDAGSPCGRQTGAQRAKEVESAHKWPVRRHHHRQRRWRRHARPAPGADRQAHPDPRAWRLAAARAGELGRRGGLRREPLRPDGDLVRQEQQGLSAGRPLLGRRRDQAVRRGAVSAAQRGLRRAEALRRHLARPGRSATTRWSRTTPGPSRCTRSTARAARIRPSRRPARRIRFPRCRTSRASSSCTTISAKAGYHPFHSPNGIMLNESAAAVQRLHPLRQLRRLSLPAARQVRRGGDRRPARAASIPTSRC